VCRLYATRLFVGAGNRERDGVYATIDKYDRHRAGFSWCTCSRSRPGRGAGARGKRVASLGVSAHHGKRFGREQAASPASYDFVFLTAALGSRWWAREALARARAPESRVCTVNGTMASQADAGTSGRLFDRCIRRVRACIYNIIHTQGLARGVRAGVISMHRRPAPGDLVAEQSTRGRIFTSKLRLFASDAMCWPAALPSRRVRTPPAVNLNANRIGPVRGPAIARSGYMTEGGNAASPLTSVGCWPGSCARAPAATRALAYDSDLALLASESSSRSVPDDYALSPAYPSSVWATGTSPALMSIPPQSPAEGPLRPSGASAGARPGPHAFNVCMQRPPVSQRVFGAQLQITHTTPRSHPAGRGLDP
jgi:hypothetical protein